MRRAGMKETIYVIVQFFDQDIYQAYNGRFLQKALPASEIWGWFPTKEEAEKYLDDRYHRIEDENDDFRWIPDDDNKRAYHDYFKIQKLELVSRRNQKMDKFVQISDKKGTVWIRRELIAGVYIRQDQDNFGSWDVVIDLEDSATKYYMSFENKEQAEKEAKRLILSLN